MRRSASYYNQNAITQADRAKEALDRGDLHGAHRFTTDAAAGKTADIIKNTQTLNQLADAPTVNSGKTSAAYRQSDAALDGGAHSAQTKAEYDNLQVAIDDNLAARKTVDAKLASAETKNKDAELGLDDDAPAPPERKSIDCAHLTCSQLAPPLPEGTKLAANDPAPEPPADPHQLQKPAVPRPKNDGTIT